MNKSIKAPVTRVDQEKKTINRRLTQSHFENKGKNADSNLELTTNLVEEKEILDLVYGKKGLNEIRDSKSIIFDTIIFLNCTFHLRKLLSNDQVKVYFEVPGPTEL